MTVQPLTSIEKRITEKFGNILKRFKILYHGWEMDGYGYVVNSGDKNKLIVTTHNTPTEVDTSILKEKIREYGDAILETGDIIKMLNDE